MKRRAPMKRTPIARGTSELKRTELHRSAPIARGREAKPRPNGPVKARSESTHIPDPIRKSVYARDQWRCMRCGVYIPGSGLRWGLQHRRPRQTGGSRLLHTMPNLVLLCGWTVDAGTCTEWVELIDRTRAAAEGWLLPRKFSTVTPEEWPVRRWTADGPRWMQPGDEWAPATPHPRQLELGAAA